MTKKLYETTGMYIDWGQLIKLPEIDTLVDIGVGPEGTPELYEQFEKKKLILIDPLEEAKKYAIDYLSHREVTFYQTALGQQDGCIGTINVQGELGNSSLLDVSQMNYKDDSIDKRNITINRLDSVLKNKDLLGNIGIKIDVEGFELDVILGAPETLKQTKFVLAEVRHNHESFKGVYKLHEFINIMHKNNFILSMILTAKPFIADLCFQPISDLNLLTEN
jgi:FkbM family methyltransferase